MATVSEMVIRGNTRQIMDKRARDAEDATFDLFSNDKLDAALFEKGAIYHGGDDSYYGESRARTRMFYAAKPFYVRVLNESGTARAFMNVFTKKGVYSSESGWITYGGYEPGYYRIMLSLNPNDNTSKTVNEILAAFEIKAIDEKRTGEYIRGGLDTNYQHDMDYRSNTRVMTASIEKAETDILINVVNSGYTFLVDYYTAGGAKGSNSGWKTGYYIIPEGSYYRIVFDKSGSSSAFFTEDEILANFEIAPICKDFQRHMIENSIGGLFIHGTFYGEEATVTDYQKDARIATAKVMKCGQDLMVYNKGMKIAVILFSDPTTMEKTYSWLTDDFFIPKNTYFAMTITEDEASSTAVAKETLLAGVEFGFANEYAGSINPNVILQSRNVDDTRFPPYSKWYMQAAAKNQYDRVRVNLRVTPDGYYVLIHNNTINAEARNADGSLISTEINSSGTNYSVLNSYDWGIKYGPKYAGMGVPTLEDAAKYAALYNLGMSLEIPYTLATVDRETVLDHVCEVLGQYGLLENLIYISGSLHAWDEMDYLKTKSPYISYLIGTDTLSNFKDAAFQAHIQSLMTGYNTIYVSNGAWGSTPTTEEIEYCNEKGYKLYNSGAMSKSALFSTYFPNHGITLVEANNVYMIKDTLIRHADEESEGT